MHFRISFPHLCQGRRFAIRDKVFVLQRSQALTLRHEQSPHALAFRLCTCSNDAVQTLPPLHLAEIIDRKSRGRAILRMCSRWHKRFTQHSTHLDGDQEPSLSCWSILVHAVHRVFRRTQLGVLRLGKPRQARLCGNLCRRERWPGNDCKDGHKKSCSRQDHKLTERILGKSTGDD